MDSIIQHAPLRASKTACAPHRGSRLDCDARIARQSARGMRCIIPAALRAAIRQHHVRALGMAATELPQ